MAEADSGGEMNDRNIPTDPVILPYAEMQKKAERDGVDIMVYVNSMHAHVQRQRDEITRLREQLSVCQSAKAQVMRDNEELQEKLRGRY